MLLLGCLEVASSGPLFTLFTPAYFQLYCVPKPQAWFKLQCFLQACRITLTAKQMSLKNWKIKLAFDGSLHCAGFWQQIMGFLGNFVATHTVEKLEIGQKIGLELFENISIDGFGI